MVCSDESMISFLTKLKNGSLFFLLVTLLYRLPPMTAFLFERDTRACLLSSGFVLVGSDGPS